MQEAFERAAKGKEGTEIARVVDDRSKIISGQRELDALKTQAQQIGRDWFKGNIGIQWSYSERRVFGPSNEDLRLQLESLLRTAFHRPLRDKVEVLGTLSSGFAITEGYINPDYTRVINIEETRVLDFILRAVRVVRPSVASRAFMAAFTHLCDYSPEQQVALKRYIYKQAGLKGDVKLPQIFPAVVSWLEQTPDSE